MLLDIDDYKKINDTNGHLPRDEILKALAQELGEVIRQADCDSR